MKIGTDIIEMKRLAKAIRKPRFMAKYYTPAEIALIESRGKQAIAIAATNFCAKEAVAKALGTGFKNFWPSDIEVLRRDTGEPYVVLHGQALTALNNLHLHEVSVSLSHCKAYALATALVC